MKHIFNTDAVVRDCGNVYGQKGLKKLTVNGNGYLVFSCKNIITGKRIVFLYHRALWETKFGPIPEGLVINHKDGNKLNNNLENLEVITSRENILHSINVLGNQYYPAKKFSEDTFLTLLTLQNIKGFRGVEKIYKLPENSLRVILINRTSYPIKATPIVCVYPNPCSRKRGNCISYWNNVNGSQITIDKNLYDYLKNLKYF